VTVFDVFDDIAFDVFDALFNVFDDLCLIV